VSVLPEAGTELRLLSRHFCGEGAQLHLQRAHQYLVRLGRYDGLQSL
jgi:hypothetical protein